MSRVEDRLSAWPKHALRDRPSEVVILKLNLLEVGVRIGEVLETRRQRATQEVVIEPEILQLVQRIKERWEWPPDLVVAQVECLDVPASTVLVVRECMDGALEVD